jgi:hypothetical protein
MRHQYDVSVGTVIDLIMRSTNSRRRKPAGRQ